MEEHDNPDIEQCSQCIEDRKMMSGGWSLEQKEAIREQFVEIGKDYISNAFYAGERDMTSKRLVDHGHEQMADECMAVLEAITKGEQPSETENG